MISLLKCGCLIVIILIMGDVINGLLFKNRFKDTFALRFSLAYGFGTGVLGLLLFYLSYLGFQLNLTNTLLLTIPFLAIFVFKLTKGFQPSLSRFSLQNTLKKNGIIEYFFISLIILSLILIIFKALFLPMHLADDRAQWGLKAKILYHDKTIYSEDFFDKLRIKFHVNYPFLIPLLESSFYNFMGETNDSLVKTPFPLFFISLLFFLYASQRRYTSHRYALLFTAVLATLPAFIKDLHGNPSSGYADLPLTFYYAVSIISISNWIKDSKQSNLILSALFMLFAVFTKKEGLILWMVAIFLISFFLLIPNRRERTNKIYFFITFVLMPLIFLIPWFQFSSTLNLPSWEKDWSLSQFNPDYIFAHLYRIPSIATKMKNIFFTTRYWNVLWVIFFIVVFLYPKKSFAFPQAFILLTVSINILSLSAAILLFPWDWWYTVLYDMHRMMMVNIPLLVYFISYQIHQAGIFQPQNFTENHRISC